MLFETRLEKILVGLFVVILAWAAFLLLQTETTSLANYFFNVGYSSLYLFGAVVAGVGAWYSGKGSAMRKALGYFSAGLLGQAVALWIWFYYNIVFADAKPYPTLLDLFYLLLVPTLLASFYYLFRVYGVAVRKSMVRELFLMFALATLLVFLFITPPEISGHLPLFTNIVNIFYPLSDVLLLLIAYLLYLISGGHIQMSFKFFSLALILQTAGDFVFSYRSARDIYWNGDVSDILFTVAAFLFSYGMILLVKALPKENQ